MQANPVPLLAVFQAKIRLEVPLFQRQYVWTLEQQWEPLWEDVQRKFVEYLEGRKDAPVHFLGAMVIDKKDYPTGHVERRQIIDGQQRLTTLQIFIAAFRDFCREQAIEEVAKECEAFTTNTGLMANPDVDKFKIWPTQLDRRQFVDVMTSGSRAALDSKHPIVRRPYARHPEPRDRMVEAYVFFYDVLKAFFIGTEDIPAIAGEEPLAVRLEECFGALKNALQVVVIDLADKDDAQVIFETLNARGEPLLPADLLRNFIFLRAARLNEPQEELYNEHWRKFDDPFWREEVVQGRLKRPRSDLFMQHFLASRQGVDIPIKHLFVEYKFWIARKRPFGTVREELETLARQGEDFRRIIAPQPGDVLYPLATFLGAFDVSTVHPLILFLLDRRLSDTDWQKVSMTLESYLLRRAVCGWTAKNYNRNFLALLRVLERDGAHHANLRQYLSEARGESVEWPTDAAFGAAWLNRDAYGTLKSQRVGYVLRRLNATYQSNRSELIAINGDLTIEHIMPQGWRERWPLGDGSHGLPFEDTLGKPPGDPRVEATRRRDAMLHTFGNLTLVAHALNAASSNSPWPVKKPLLIASSLLPLNLQLHAVDTWDERAIESRSKTLLERAVQLWPAPTRPQ